MGAGPVQLLPRRIHPNPAWIDQLQNGLVSRHLSAGLGGNSPHHSVKGHRDARVFLEFHLAFDLACARFGLARLDLLVRERGPRQRQFCLLVHELKI